LRKLLATTLFIVSLTSCSAPPKRLSESTTVHGLSDSELQYLASRLNAHVEALGMSDYRFTSEHCSFNVVAHNDLTRRSKPFAAMPVRLLARLPGTTREIELKIQIAQGISLAEVEAKFRTFIAKVEAAGGRKSRKDFYGRWEPPALLVPFWASLQQSWWNPEDNTKIANYCRRYAQKSDPKSLVPVIVEDLRANPSVERTFVYSMLVLHCDQRVTLEMLNVYSRSPDEDRRKIANDFIADIESVEAEGR
jgi:hypothetical protein